MEGRIAIESKRRVCFALRAAAVAGMLLPVLGAGCQRTMIYHPSTESPEVLEAYAREAGYLPWRDAGGEWIGWRPEQAPEGGRRVLVFHGNAGLALHRTYYAEGFAALEESWEVILFEYPGYGARGGRPSEKAFFRGASEAVELLGREEGRPIVLVGESLGSGVAAEMARRFPDRIAGLVLVTPFTDLAEVGARHFPFLPVRLFLRDRYDNVRALREYDGPVAVLLAGRDEVIPADLGRKLYEGYSGPKRLWVQEGRTHNTLDLDPDAPFWSELETFFREHGAGP